MRASSVSPPQDALEMSMDDFHHFVVDVGLETTKYTFDIMSNQFVKPNAVNTASRTPAGIELKIACCLVPSSALY
jgi:hypothetical protein